MATDAILHAVALANRHKHDLGYVMTKSLERAKQRGELYVDTAAMAYVWRRRDGQTTLHAIVSEQPGQGSALLARIVADCRTRGQTSILARCPVDLPSNDWYRRRGFALAGTEPGKLRPLHVWRLAL